MPEKETKKRAQKAKQEGKAPTTQAGEFVREEIEHVRQGKHGARSSKQAIAIGLSKARRAGVKLPPPRKGKTSKRTRKQAERDYSRRAARTKQEALTKAFARGLPRSAQRRPPGRTQTIFIAPSAKSATELKIDQGEN